MKKVANSTSNSNNDTNTFPWDCYQTSVCSRNILCRLPILSHHMKKECTPRLRFNESNILCCFIKGFLFFFLISKVYLFVLRERTHARANGGEAEREGERKRIPSRLCAVSTEPDEGLHLKNVEIMAWAEIKSQTLNWAIQAILLKGFLKWSWRKKIVSLWEWRNQ